MQKLIREQFSSFSIVNTCMYHASILFNVFYPTFLNELHLLHFESSFLSFTFLGWWQWEYFIAWKTTYLAKQRDEHPCNGRVNSEERKTLRACSFKSQIKTIIGICLPLNKYYKALSLKMFPFLFCLVLLHRISTSIIFFAFRN
jgi:hypothetical protein